uniref:Uncharacterized protein n=1 Tax=Opuntia streptacantha TaxID=393608 RepID=A0A7C8Z7P2_OPUST
MGSQHASPGLEKLAQDTSLLLVQPPQIQIPSDTHPQILQEQSILHPNWPPREPYLLRGRGPLHLHTLLGHPHRCQIQLRGRGHPHLHPLPGHLHRCRIHQQNNNCHPKR